MACTSWLGCRVEFLEAQSKSFVFIHVMKQGSVSEGGSLSACDYWPACQVGIGLSRFQKLRCCMQLLVILLEVSSGGYFVGQADAFNISCDIVGARTQHRSGRWVMGGTTLIARALNSCPAQVLLVDVWAFGCCSVAMGDIDAFDALAAQVAEPVAEETNIASPHCPPAYPTCSFQLIQSS